MDQQSWSTASTSAATPQTWPTASTQRWSAVLVASRECPCGGTHRASCTVDNELLQRDPSFARRAREQLLAALRHMIESCPDREADS